MGLKLLYFFTILGIARSEIPSIETFDDEFKSFVQNLLLIHLNNFSSIMILHDNNGVSSLNLLPILDRLMVPVIIHDLTTPEVVLNSTQIRLPNPYHPATKKNLIIIEDSKNLRSMLEVAFSITSFSARTNIIIIFTQRVIGTESWIREVFSVLWEIYILNVGLVFHNGRVNLFTYIPWTTPHEIQNLTAEGVTANIFYNKLKNLHRYPVKILRNGHEEKIRFSNKSDSTVDLRVDDIMINSMLEDYNATSNIIVWKPNGCFRSCRFVHYNYTIQGLFGADPQNKSIDFCAFSLRVSTNLKQPTELANIGYNFDVNHNTRPLRFDIDYRFDTSYIQEWDSYCVVVPASKRIEQVFNFMKPFQGYVWLAIFLNFIIHTILYFRIEILYGSNGRSFAHTCSLLYRIQMNNIPLNSKKSRGLERSYLLWFTVYSFLISAAYQSVLISFISVPMYRSPLNSLEDLKQTDLSIRVPVPILADIVNSLDQETGDILFPKVVPDTLDINRKKFNMKEGYLMLKSHAEDLLNEKESTDNNGRPLFHIMDECPMPLLMTYQMPRGSFLLSIINEFTIRNAEAGLNEIWKEDAKLYSQENFRRPIQYEKNVILTLSHLYGAFYILLFGELIGFIAFLFEIYRKRTK